MVVVKQGLSWRKASRCREIDLAVAALNASRWALRAGGRDIYVEGNGSDTAGSVRQLVECFDHRDSTNGVSRQLCTAGERPGDGAKPLWGCGDYGVGPGRGSGPGDEAIRRPATS